MATYEDIYGKRVKFFDSDPTLNSSYEGQVWYDSATGVLKSVVSSAAAVTTTNMPTATRAVGAIGATQDAYISASGANPSTNYASGSFEYSGAGWATIASTNTARSSACKGAIGTTSAGAVLGGAGGPVYPPSGPGYSLGYTELWNGSSWSETGDMPTGVQAGEAFGTSTAAAVTGGFTHGNPPYWTEATQEFNGSSWTAGTAAPRHTVNGCGVGTQTAGMIVSQQEQPSDNYLTKTAIAQTREYDGTNWTTGGTVNLASPANAVVGTQSSCRKMGGNGPPTPSSYTNQEEWNDTVWTTDGALASDFTNGGGAGTASAAVIAGGYTSTNLLTTQEVTKTISTLTAAAWASGGTLNVSRKQTYGAGSQTAGLIFGGEGPSGDRNQTEEYNGSTWTEVNNMPATNKDHAGFGIQTAAVACGGSPNTTSLNYDGTNWTASPGSLNTGRSNAGGTGTQTAGLTFGGYPSITATEEYGGSTWTTGGALPASKSNIFAAGTQTAALGAGGGPPTSTNVYEYDGSSWTAGNALPSGTIDARGGGTQTDALYAGGYLHPGSGYPTTTLGYDGTNWSTRPSLATATAGGGAGQSAAPASANWIAGGNPTPAIAATQEFTGETETVTGKTLTTS